MAAIDMPNNPSQGETYTASNGITYSWDGEKWTAIGGGGGGSASIVVSSTPPASPTVGALWFDIDNGILYVWYIDSDQNSARGEGQWVDTRPGGVKQS